MLLLFVDIELPHFVAFFYYHECTFASPLLTILYQKRAHLTSKVREEGEITNPHDKKRRQCSSLSFSRQTVYKALLSLHLATVIFVRCIFSSFFFLSLDVGVILK